MTPPYGKDVRFNRPPYYCKCRALPPLKGLGGFATVAVFACGGASSLPEGAMGLLRDCAIRKNLL